MSRRTPTIELDEPFESLGRVTKATTDPATGKRYVRGVASGVLEDRDGERCSKRAIAKMATQATVGGAVKITSSHQQDWMTEFGDVVKLSHDPEHDELLVDCELPREGEDPIADKAWKELNSGRELGFSIGGKLRKAYYELVDGGVGKGGKPRRRKVLDDIDLRHVMLTAKPSYKATFAEAVAKSFTGDEPDDAEFSIDEDADVEVRDAARITKALNDAPEIVKAKPDTDDEADPATDSAPNAGPAAATADTAPAGDSAADGDSDAAAAEQLPMAKRHLSCPSCGHEFAADLPDDPSQIPDKPTKTDDADTAKSTTKEPPMADKTTPAKDDFLAKVAALADECGVTKTDADEAAAAAVAKTDEPLEVRDGDVVAKTADERLDDVEKMLAASHRHADERVDALSANVEKAVTTLVDVVADVRKAVLAMPQGRKSVARVLEPSVGVEKTATETDDIEKRIAETDNPVEAARLMNERDRGVR